jgi:hypothetical protein
VSGGNSRLFDRARLARNTTGLPDTRNVLSAKTGTVRGWRDSGVASNSSSDYRKARQTGSRYRINDPIWWNAIGLVGGGTTRQSRILAGWKNIRILNGRNID